MKFSNTFLMLGAISAPVIADIAPSEIGTNGDEIVIHLPSDFDRYSPRTALDMVQQVPGFSIKNRNSNQRGLGQASGNVLINGKRITSKDDSVTDILKRISASGVVQLEVFDGAISSVPGLSGQVVSVVLAEDGFSGTFNWAPRFDRGDDPMLTEGEVSLKGNKGRLGYNLGLVSTGYKRGRTGVERVYNGAGERLEHRDINTYYYHTDPTLAAGLSFEGDAGSVLTITSKYRRRFVDDEEEYQSYRPTVKDDLFLKRSFTSSERERSGELGVDFEMGIGSGRLKLISLYRFEHSPYENRRVTEYADLTPTVQTHYHKVQDEAEKIVRGEYSWTAGEIHSWQLSSEVAFNSLDAAATLENIAPDGDVSVVELPHANSSVEEQRREANISYGRPFTNTLSMQLSLGVEYSQISQSGSVRQTREFVRPKGFASLAWRPNASWSLSAKVERQVGQLDFDDFVASVNLEDNTADAGNPNLVPPQTWLIELESVINFGSMGVINLRAYQKYISDIVDQIPIGSTGEAPGNISRAERYGLATTTTVKFDSLGLPGVQTNLDIDYQNSEVADPLTADMRPISGDKLAKLDMEIRHDIQNNNIAWGIKVIRDWQADRVRLDQVSSKDRRLWLGLFVEHKNLFGLTARVEAQDLTCRSSTYAREVFHLRRTDQLSFFEKSKLEDGYGLIVSIRGEF
ncbi:hypothetical protein QP938_12525 [Porticoccaceae bacterium LTM1]|nr:hypothetical protein QP938_12525 [Porticoccaceae bacterium LTM1]